MSKRGEAQLCPVSVAAANASAAPHSGWHQLRVEVIGHGDPTVVHRASYYVPAAPRGSRAGAVQINDVFVDERGVVYAVDRLVGGLYVLEMNM